MSLQSPPDRLIQLEADNARLRALLDERGAPAMLRHQTRNMLALMRGILRHSTAGTRTVDEYAAKVEGRFEALLRVQTILIASPEQGAELHRIVADELTAHLIRVGETAELSGPEIRLDAKAAEVVALAVHELTMNAIEHGPMNRPAGRLSVTWAQQPEPPALTVLWRETGAPAAGPGPARGFGLETLQDLLPYQLGAETRLDFRADGLECTIALPFRNGERQTVII